MAESRRKRRRLIAAGAVVVAAAVVAAVMLRGDGPPPDRDEVAAYAAIVKELSFEGGRLLQSEIKPRITDLREGGVTPEQFRREADNWIGLYEQLRERFAKAERPERLERAARLYDRAMLTYIMAFQAFREASLEPTQDERNAAISDAVPIAEKADERFDVARDELVKQMRAVGLTPPSDL